MRKVVARMREQGGAQKAFGRPFNNCKIAKYMLINYSMEQQRRR